MAKDKAVSQVSRTLTNSELSDVQAALAMLAGIVSSKDFGADGKPLPEAGEVISSDLAEAVLVRVAVAYRAKVGESEREEKKVLYQALSTRVHQARLARIALYKEVLSLSPAARAMMGSNADAPKAAYLPLSEVADLFAEGTSKEEMTKRIHVAGFKFGKGAGEAGPRILCPIGEDVLARAVKGESISSEVVAAAE